MDIYSMKLHDVAQITFSGIGNVAISYAAVIRVPGGWIYQIWDEEVQEYVREIFVPFNNEFMLNKN